MARDPDPSLVGRTIAGKFAIESAIAGGAMGAVYRARQIALDKAVAIKVMHRELSRDPNYVARFLREAKAASRIDHPNSVRVIDFGEEPDGLLYLAMELLDGRDLYTLLRAEGPLEAARVGDIILQVLAAVAAAHEMGVVHRDIKPENIMIQRGTDDEGRSRDVVKVCDFGIAKITDHHGGNVEPVTGPSITTEGLVVGTPEYMSPEQGRGETLDARSDVYSVGIILYQMLVGRVPFDAESALGIVLKHVTEEPQPPSFVRAGVDPGLEAVCLRALKKKREERYQTARAMRADVRNALEGRNVGTDDVRSVTAVEATAIVSAATEPAPRPPHDKTPVVPDVAPRNPPTPVVGTADTAVAFDSSAIRALHRSSPPAEVPAELPLAVLPRRRWTGIVLGALLLLGAFGAIAFQLRRVNVAPDPTPASSASSTAAIDSSGPLLHVTPPASAIEPAPSASTARATRDPKHPTHGGKPGPSTLADAGAAPAANAADSSVVSTTPPPPDAAHAADAGATPAASASATPNASGPWSPKNAKVAVGRVNALGVAPEQVRAVIPDAKLQQCYRAALTAGGPKPPPSAMTLHLDANEEGKINSANLNGSPPIPKTAGNCIMHAMMGKQVTGEGGAPMVSADVELTFSVE